MGGEDANGKKSDSRQPPGSSYPEKKDGMKLWGILIFGVIGATATTFAVSQLRRTVDWFYVQVSSCFNPLVFSCYSDSRFNFKTAWNGY
ncbi:unnamed protein product [Linum tenue]|uniref:Uncharacterized protein n=1 Tax=Linum tenue TaxID=586396 RepID=A0AAV0NZS5_9ROSI|nr:unnamed protein product [Linum tenue]